MQSTLLLSGLALLGVGLTCSIFLRGKGRSKTIADRMQIELDFDAAKMREQKRH